jgi:hypothetical protein
VTKRNTFARLSSLFFTQTARNSQKHQGCEESGNTRTVRADVSCRQAAQARVAGLG